MKRLTLVIIAILAVTGVMAQLNPMTPIPADKDVRIGKLENGMTYYIRHNEKPKGQADFYIFHNVGAIQENDAQQGLAHFLEHMAFNGTKNMPGKMIMTYLEKIGVKFGVNLNAGTSWDMTVYNISDVPTSRKGIIDTALLILHDWSQFITLDPKEIDSERGVISEELRTRDGAGWRAAIKELKAVGKGSKYEQRNLIGYLDGLKNFSYQELVDFYHQWYRPDYQALIIVGDVDVDAVEAKIKSLMSDILAPKADASIKEAVTVPDNDEPIISIYTDPEMQNSQMNIYFKRPAMPIQANNLVLKQMLDYMCGYVSVMANNRLDEISMQPDAPFLNANMHNGKLWGGMIPTLDVTQLSLQTEDGKLLPGAKALYTEVEKIRRHGFTQSEFERAQENFMRRAERSYTNRNDRQNEEYVQRYIANYQSNEAIPDAQTEWELDSTLIKTITLDMVNDLASKLITEENKVIVINAPEKEGIINPNEAEITAVISEVMASDIEAYADNTVKEPLIAANAALKGSPVKKTSMNKTLGTTEWTLKNGIKVIVKPTTYKADEVRIDVTTKGGLSLLSDEQFYTGALLPAIQQLSGVSKFSSTDLRKQLSGKSASVSLSTGYYDNGMSGYGSPKDIETMLQLLYLNFTQPRFDENDFNTLVKNYKSYVANLESNPDFIAQKAFTNTIYNNNPRRQQLSTEIIDNMKFADLKDIYTKLYPNANSFTFTIVGNVDLATLKPLVEKYIGSIPTSKVALNFANDNVAPVKGEVVNDFKTPMQQPKVTEMFYFSGDCDFSIENKAQLVFLTQALTARYLQSIREEKGGTYGVSVLGNLEDAPKNTYYMLINFDTNEEMADELAEAVMEEIRNIAENGPKTEDIEKTREFLLKSWNNSLEQNEGWMNYIDRFYTNNLDYITNYENIVKNITNEDIQNFAKKILTDNNIAKVVMRPATADAK